MIFTDFVCMVHGIPQADFPVSCGGVVYPLLWWARFIAPLLAGLIRRAPAEVVAGCDLLRPARRDDYAQG